MLQFVLQLITLIKNILTSVLIISYKTGHLLVSFLDSATKTISVLLKNISGAAQVLFEDFGLFVYDVVGHLKVVVTISEGIYEGICRILTTFRDLIALVLFGIVEFYNVVLECFVKVYRGVGYTAQTIKWLILLVGSGVWFAITAIPTLVIYLLTLSVYLSGCLVQELYEIATSCVYSTVEFVQNTFNFFIDVPLESLAGLTIATLCVYLLKKHGSGVVEGFRERQAVVRVGFPDDSSSSHESQSESDEEQPVADKYIENQMCLICQTRVKCVVMLPCRHVCVCSVCNERLKIYSRNCPLCRVFVHETMLVYL